MEKIVFTSKKGNLVTSSHVVAREFQKEHKHVVRDIRDLKCSEEFKRSNFGLMVGVNELPNGRKQKFDYYIMTKDGFSFLVMGYTGSKAASFKEKFINEFNKMESLLKNDDYILNQAHLILQRRLEKSEKLLLEAQEVIKEGQQIIAKQQPKVLFAECVQSADDSILIGTLAKLIAKQGVSIGEKRLFKWMRDSGYLHRYGERYNLPTQRSIDLGILETTERTFGNSEHQRVSLTPKVTGKGQIYFINKFAKKVAS